MREEKVQSDRATFSRFEIIYDVAYCHTCGGKEFWSPGTDPVVLCVCKDHRMSKQAIYRKVLKMIDDLK